VRVEIGGVAENMLRFQIFSFGRLPETVPSCVAWDNQLQIFDLTLSLETGIVTGRGTDDFGKFLTLMPECNVNDLTENRANTVLDIIQGGTEFLVSGWMKRAAEQLPRFGTISRPTNEYASIRDDSIDFIEGNQGRFEIMAAVANLNRVLGEFQRSREAAGGE
jgi:hypothetical protein